MKCMTHREFEARWQRAQNQPQQLEVKKTEKHQIRLSLDTVLDNYAARLEQAVQAHVLDKEECEALCQKLEELKPLVRKVEKRASKYLVI